MAVNFYRQRQLVISAPARSAVEGAFQSRGGPRSDTQQRHPGKAIYQQYSTLPTNGNIDMTPGTIYTQNASNPT